MKGLGLFLCAAWLAGCGRDPNTPDPSPNYDSRAISRCERGADDGEPTYTVQTWRACLYAARMFADQPPTQLRYAKRSCDMGYDEGCLVYLDFVRAAAVRGDDAAREYIEPARASGKKFCEEGLLDFVRHDPRTGEACHLAGLLFQDVSPPDPETAKAMFTRGCERHDEGSCQVLRGKYGGSAPGP